MSFNSRFTKKNQDILVEASAVGLPVQQQAALIGVSHPTVFNWIRRGHLGREQMDENGNYVGPHAEYAAWLDRWEAAKADAAMEFLKLIKAQATDRTNPKAWIAAMTWLERNFPQEYGQKQALQVQSDTRVTIVIEEVDGQEWKSKAIPAAFSPDPTPVGAIEDGD